MDRWRGTLDTLLVFVSTISTSTMIYSLSILLTSVVVVGRFVLRHCHNFLCAIARGAFPGPQLENERVVTKPDANIHRRERSQCIAGSNCTAHTLRARAQRRSVELVLVRRSGHQCALLLYFDILVDIPC